MAKDRRDAQRHAGEALLRQWGVADAAAVSALEECAGRDADADLAIVHRLGAMVGDASVVALKRLAGGADRETGKEIKRALYRLQQRGVEVPRESRKRPVLSVAPRLEGYVSAFDGRGDRLVWLVKPGSGGLLHLFAVVNDPGGLREVAINRITRKALREIQEELRSKHDIVFVEVDWRRADAGLQLALGWARDQNATVQGDYTALRSQLTSEPSAMDLGGAAPALAFDIDLGDAGAHLENSAALLLEPELRTWLLAEEVVRPVIGEIGEIRSSPLVLNQAQQEERFAAIYGRVTGEAFADAESWARRLEEMAHYFAKTSREPCAQQAAAVAAELRARGSVLDIPFCVIYVRRTLSMYLQESDSRSSEQQKSSLILTPDQVRKQRR